MKTTIFLFSLLLFMFNETYAQWQFLNFANEEIRAVAVHPTNPNIVLAGGTHLYRSQDGGITWDTVSNINANSFIFHPLYPDTIYTTFGAGSNSDGLYKSTNCGNTWSVVSYFDFASCIAGTEGGIYRHYPNYWNNTSAAVNITVPGLSVYRENVNLIWAALDGGSYSDGM